MSDLSATAVGTGALDPAHIADRVRGALPGTDLSALRSLPGGFSSVTLAAELRDGDTVRAIVLKVAPPGLTPVLNRDVLRQARILRALADLDGFPVPRVLLEDAGDPPLFAMDLLAGQSYEPFLDVAADAPSPATARGRMLTAARALAALHRASPASRGLGEEPVVSPGDELTRWKTLVDTVDRSIAPGRDDVAALLLERVPDSLPAVVQHGDYRLQNMLFDGAELLGVIDWEIWSIGDPRSDLAWLAMHLAPAHVFDENRPEVDRAASSDLPSREELLSAYLEAGGIASAIDGLDWFVALAYFKTAATMSAILKRDRRRAERDPRLVVAERHLDGVLAAATTALGTP